MCFIITCIDRDPDSKHYLHPKLYQDTSFPPFITGASGYVFTGSLVPLLYSCALRTPFINLEDVFLTGLCGSQQLNLRLSHNPEFIWQPMPVIRSHSCFYKNSITVHGLSPRQLQKVWNQNKDLESCNSTLFTLMTYICRFIEWSVEFCGGTL